jgi:hypothetical protein
VRRGLRDYLGFVLGLGSWERVVGWGWMGKMERVFEGGEDWRNEGLILWRWTILCLRSGIVDEKI